MAAGTTELSWGSELARIAAKLSQVRRTTELGFHTEPRFNEKGKTVEVIVPNEWAFVYGRLVKTPRLSEDCGAKGCGGDDVPLVIVAKEQEVRTLAGGDVR